MPRAPQLLYLLEPTSAATGRSGQHLREEQSHKTFGWTRELTQQERFDGTAFSKATVEIRINRLAAQRMTADWRIRDQYGVIYRVDTIAPSDNRLFWVVRAQRTKAPFSPRPMRPLLLENDTPLLLEDGKQIHLEEGPVV